jgi:hypothetical protein
LLGQEVGYVGQTSSVRGEALIIGTTRRGSIVMDIPYVAYCKWDFGFLFTFSPRVCLLSCFSWCRPVGIISLASKTVY